VKRLRRPRRSRLFGEGHVAGAQEYQPKHGAPHSVLGREPRLGEDTVNVGRLGILAVLREGVGIELETIVEMIYMDNGHAL